MMNKWSTNVRRTIYTLLLLTLIAAGTLGGSTGAQAASLSQTTVYYDSDGMLYKVSGDGSNTAEVMLDFEGVNVKAAGSYLYYTQSGSSTTLLRVPNNGSSDTAETYAKDVIEYYTDNGFIYYLDSTGAIYRANGDQSASTATKITSTADTDFPLLLVTKSRVYYNALVNGKTWIVSKASNGSGTEQRIAAGAVEGLYFMNPAKNEMQLLVNTNPYEQYYSTNAVVMYKVNYNSGKATAVNPQAKLDVNAAYSGGWGNNMYVYNKGITLNSNKDYNYAVGKAFALTTSGKTFQLHSKSVREVNLLGTDKVIITDTDKKAYAKTVNGSKVIKSADLNLSNITYSTYQLTNGAPTTVYLSNNKGVYAVNTALKVTKLAGEEWETFRVRDDIPGMFYVHANDQYRLYHVQADGSGKKALSETPLDDIVQVTSN